MVAVSPSTSGYPLVSNGSSTDPSFSQLNLASAVIGTLPVTNGGTGVTSLTAHYLLVGGGTSLATIAPSSTNGYPLVSSGSSANPVFAQLSLATAVTGTLSVANGGTGAATFTAHSVLVGEGTGAVASIAPGTSGYPLVSNGSSADPMFSQLNLAAAVSGTLPLTNGGTGLTSGGSASQLLGVQASGGTGLEYKTLVAGTGITITPSVGQIAISSTATGSAFPLANQCRLYSVTGQPYADTDPMPTTSTPSPSGSQTLYFGPCPTGGGIYLYSSGAWSLITASQTSLSLAGLSTATIYDIYVYNNDGSVAIDTPVAWSGNTPPTRGTQDGVTVKNGDSTRLWVGCIETWTNGSGYIVVVSFPGYRGVWNAYNRVQASLAAVDTSSGWSYSSGTWRIANGRSASSYGLAISRVVTELQAEAVCLTRYTMGPVASYEIASFVGLGVDSTTPVVIGKMFATSYTNSGQVTACVPYSTVQLGAHSYESIEAGGGGACEFYGQTYGGLYGTTTC